MCMTKKELETKVAELRSLKAMREEVDDEIKAKERAIIEYMTERCDFAFHTTKELYEFLFTP